MKFLLMAGLSMLATPVFAHHPLAGAQMETFLHGLVSGIGHPVVGYEHLFFVLTVGIAAVFTNRRLLAPAFFIGGVLGGVALIMAGVQLPLVELMIAFSLLLLGGIVLAGKALSFNVAAMLFTVSGLFHGWAYGETLAGQESLYAGVVTGYLIGLAIIQWLIAVAVGFIVLRVWQTTTSAALQPRLAGAVVAGAGAVFILQYVESLLSGVIAGV